MKRNYKKILAGTALCILSVSVLAGCEPSKKKVLSSSYYKELQKENENLEKKVDKLEEKAEKADEPKVDEERAEDYLDKIVRDNLVKLEVGYADNMDGSEFVEDEAVFSLATSIANRADLTDKYTPEEVAKEFGPGYEYILYDEDNAIYEIYVYGGNYVVFTDLPNNVYYAYNASAIGDAFLHYRNGYPNSNLLHRLADTPVITDKEKNYFESTTALEAANCIDQMEKKKTNRQAAEKKWKKKYKEENGSYEPESVVYTFYHHGNRLVLTIYDKYYSIENMDGKKTWYQAKKTEVNQLKNIFIEAAQDQAKEKSTQQSDETEKNSNEASHSSEIQEESDISTEND